MENGKKNRGIMLNGVIVLVVLTVILRSCAGAEETGTEAKQEYTLPQREKEEKKVPMDKQHIYNMKGQADDNLRTLEEADPGSKMELQFIGYEENKKAFAWLPEADWKLFQEQLKTYLDRKGLEVTTVTLHPGSQQVIDEYLRYLYLDVDYATEYTDRLLIKAVCDTYKGSLRFAFEIQYGD